MNGKKLRLLIMGCILIILGTAIYSVRGVDAVLILPVVGIALLIGGIVYPNKKVKPEEAVVK